MPKPPQYPPTFEELIDQLTNIAANFSQEWFDYAAGELKSRIGQYTPQSHSQPYPKRVKGSPKVQKRAPGGQSAPQDSKQAKAHKPAIRTAYTVLGVDPKADIRVIQAVYRIMAHRWHPDTNKSPQAGERMKELNAAWAILKDPEKRRKYDQGMGL
jgi:hypothetical protein